MVKLELDHPVRVQFSQIHSGAVKRLNARRVKIHRTYTVDEAARLFQFTRIRCAHGSNPDCRRQTIGDQFSSWVANSRAFSTSVDSEHANSVNRANSTVSAAVLPGNRLPGWRPTSPSHRALATSEASAVPVASLCGGACH